MNTKHQFSKKVIVTAAFGLLALAPLHSFAANKFVVNGSDGVTPAVVVSTAGNLGIGNPNPYYPLQLQGYGPASATTVEIRNTGNPFPNPAPWDAPTFQMIRNNAASVNGGLPQTDDRFGYFTFGTYVGSTIRYAAGISAYADGTGDATSYPGYLAFETTTPSNAYPSEKLRITSSGNIGVGTAQPTQKLEVNGGVRLNTLAAQPTCDATQRGTMWFTQGGSGVADTLQVCAKGADDSYSWKTVTVF